jgi:hypothetical protein
MLDAVPGDGLCMARAVLVSALNTGTPVCVWGNVISSPRTLLVKSAERLFLETVIMKSCNILFVV